jgi:hypothetical protein
MSDETDHEALVRELSRDTGRGSEPSPFATCDRPTQQTLLSEGVLQFPDRDYGAFARPPVDRSAASHPTGSFEGLIPSQKITVAVHEPSRSVASSLSWEFAPGAGRRSRSLGSGLQSLRQTLRQTSARHPRPGTFHRAEFSLSSCTREERDRGDSARAGGATTVSRDW